MPIIARSEPVRAAQSGGDDDREDHEDDAWDEVPCRNEGRALAKHPIAINTAVGFTFGSLLERSHCETEH